MKQEEDNKSKVAVVGKGTRKQCYIVNRCTTSFIEKTLMRKKRSAEINSVFNDMIDFFSSVISTLCHSKSVKTVRSLVLSNSRILNLILSFFNGKLLRIFTRKSDIHSAKIYCKYDFKKLDGCFYSMLTFAYLKCNYT